MKRIIGVALAIILAITSCCLPVQALASVERDVTISGAPAFKTEDEWKEAIKAQIAEELAQQGIENSYIYFPGDPEPLNDVNDYKTEVVARGIASAEGWAGNQPPGGYIFNSPLGGNILYYHEGGPTITVGASLNLLNGAGSVSVSVPIPLGKCVSDGGVIGVSVPVPGYRAYKLWVKNNWTVVQYVIYHWGWVNDMEGWQWQEWSGGTSKTYFNTEYTPLPV